MNFSVNRLLSEKGPVFSWGDGGTQDRGLLFLYHVADF